MPVLPPETPPESIFTPALWGVIGVVFTKALDYLASKSKVSTDGTVEFSKSQQKALDQEREARDSRERMLVEEIEKLTIAYNESQEKLQTERESHFKSKKVNLILEQRIGHLQLALTQAGVPLPPDVSDTA
jgi:hypothetical protein